MRYLSRERRKIIWNCNFGESRSTCVLRLANELYLAWANQYLLAVAQVSVIHSGRFSSKGRSVSYNPR